MKKKFLTLALFALLSKVSFAGWITNIVNQSNMPALAAQLDNVLGEAPFDQVYVQSEISFDPNYFIPANGSYSGIALPVVYARVNTGWGGLWIGTKAGIFVVTNQPVLEIHTQTYGAGKQEGSTKICANPLFGNVTLTIKSDGTLSCS